MELDKENDYYTRPASPAHTHDPYADDDFARSEVTGVVRVMAPRDIVKICKCAVCS